MTSCIPTVLVGSVLLLGEKGVPSGIFKRPITRPLRFSQNGIESDAQGDRRHHGGPDKAVHHYPFEHYASWRSEIGPHAALERPGAFGENLSTTGLTEETIALGDVFRLGQAVLQVSQGRQPCFKLNLRFSTAAMARCAQEKRRTGWYYRVLEEGIVAPGDELVLTDRPLPDWPIGRLLRVLYTDTLNREELSLVAKLDILPESWRNLALRRLRNGKVEDWEKRLSGN